MDHYNESDDPVHTNSPAIRDHTASPAGRTIPSASGNPKEGKGVPGLWPEINSLHGGCHMNKYALVICIFIMLFPICGQGSTLPEKATYHLFTNGIRVGTNKIEFKEKDGKIIITSVTSFAYEDNELEMKCTTIADAKTYQTLRVTYEGKKSKRSVAGDFILDSDTLTGTMTDEGNEYPFNAKLSGNGTYAMQENNMEHLMLLLQDFVPSGEYVKKYQLFFPIYTTIGETNAHFESERELPIGDTSLICKKVSIVMQLSDVFILFVDPKNNLPAYALYPSTKWEAFLESYFGEEPITFYRHPDTMVEPEEEESEEEAPKE
jgi:hypothetical protein